ncbi:MAG TPA: ABC transporter ATP-binding protein [Steroidobacteraceae bacterium]|jgi:ABC-type multidrug transport system ATPase subunit|nr:ABC transporter ATP-binding protein [Steroidobacteraceae bacterium]
MNILSVAGLTKHYGMLKAVDDLSFDVHSGQVFGFLGPNGSGKTTTIGMIFGIVTPTAGHLRLFGSDDPRALAQSRRRVGGTLEQPNLYPYLTGRQNLHLVAAIKRLDDSHIEPALRSVDLLAAADRRTKGYSLGMKQRLALAAAMLGDPELLIFDEPTNGLDPEGMQEIRELILRLSRSGRTIVLCTHLLAEVERVCTHVAILKQGRLLRSGAVSELTAGAPVFRLRADNAQALWEAVANYPAARQMRRENEVVYTELADSDPALLSRYLAGLGIYLAELSNQRPTLEATFLRVTASGNPDAGPAP